jgi:hypothetical protein
MFLVKDRRFGADRYVFTHTDPHSDGYSGDVLAGVTLEYDMNAIFLWPDGEPQPNPQLGRDPKHPKRYKVFKFPKELRAAGYELVHSSSPFVAVSWSDYRKRYYPVPEEYAKTMTQDEWFDFLEETDTATIIRKKLNRLAEPKPGSPREKIAEWLARRHMAADGAIRQVYYLGTGSPADEIRLLEVSERFTGEPKKIHPVVFGVDVAGAQFNLHVADVSGERLGKIKEHPMKLLPAGWNLKDAVVWERRR